MGGGEPGWLRRVCLQTSMPPRPPGRGALLRPPATASARPPAGIPPSNGRSRTRARCRSTKTISSRRRSGPREPSDARARVARKGRLPARRAPRRAPRPADPPPTAPRPAPTVRRLEVPPDHPEPARPMRRRHPARRPSGTAEHRPARPPTATGPHDLRPHRRPRVPGALPLVRRRTVPHRNAPPPRPTGPHDLRLRETPTAQQRRRGRRRGRTVARHLGRQPRPTALPHRNAPPRPTGQHRNAPPRPTGPHDLRLLGIPTAQ